MRLRKLTYLLALTISGLMSAAAWSSPLPAGILNNGALLDTAVDFQSQAYPLNFSFGAGGGFNATVDGYATTVWCVDSQEDITYGTLYAADLVALPSISTYSTDVHYGTLSGVYNATTNPTGFDLALGSDNYAQVRFEMAAYLVSQYQGYPNGPIANATDINIQSAIWEIMYNGNPNPSCCMTWSMITGDGSSASAVSSYISQAQAFVDNPANASYFNDFAILSGNVTGPSGALGTPGYQTFLVQLPEPSTWMMLLAGLGLVWLGRRKPAIKVQ